MMRGHIRFLLGKIGYNADVITEVFKDETEIFYDVTEVYPIKIEVPPNPVNGKAALEEEAETSIIGHPTIRTYEKSTAAKTMEVPTIQYTTTPTVNVNGKKENISREPASEENETEEPVLYQPWDEEIADESMLKNLNPDAAKMKKGRDALTAFQRVLQGLSEQEQAPTDTPR